VTGQAVPDISKGHSAFIFVVKQSKTRLLDHKDEDTAVLKTLGHINLGFKSSSNLTLAISV
jgi:hypothetical protein